jgi:tripartite-type tricarboxylate transporter receptor subunit TctC
MKIFFIVFFALMNAFTSAVQAQSNMTETYPNKTIKILVGFTPGGGPDITARFLATRMAEIWKQPVVVENRVGAGSNIAAQALATAAPDGYTLLSVSSAHAVAPAIYAKLPFDAQKDFSGITLTATGPALVIVPASLGVKTMSEFIAMAKAKPGQFNFASAGKGSGSHFAVELLMSQAGINMVHIPYKGIPEALTETIAGRVQLFIAPYASAINLVKDGKALAIAVTSTKRMPDLPEIATVAEANLPNYEWVFWYGLLAPAKTPKAIIDKLNAEVVNILKQPEVRQRFTPLGIAPATNTPDEFDKLIASEIAVFNRLAKAANIKPE